MSAENPDLPLLRLQLRFEALERVDDLPEFRGAFWRGLFGRALKRFSESQEPFEALWPQSVATVATGGIARAALPAVLAAFGLAAQDGLGRADAAGRRGRARLADAMLVWREEGAACSILSREGQVSRVGAAAPVVAGCPASVLVTLATPLRIMRDGAALGPRDFTPGDLLEGLVRRVSTLQKAHGPRPVAADFAALFARAALARMGEVDLHLAGRLRWSGSQRQQIAMDGIAGSFRLAMAGLEPLWPYLWLGQWLHAGKGAAMGLGAIRLGR